MSTLSQEEIDALVNQLNPSEDAEAGGAPAAGAAPIGPGVDGKKVKAFDFRFAKKLEKFSTNQLQTLRTLHDNFTRLLNNALSVYLRTRVEATVVSIDQISYGDFISGISVPSILSIFSMDPLPGSGITQMDLNLSFSIIDRLLGGPGWFPTKLRDLTDIERTLMQRFLGRMLNSYRESWNYLLTLSLKIEALDSNPQFIPRIIPLDQIVAFVSCELKIGDMTGAMTFCLPHVVLQSIGAQLADFQWSPTIVAGRGMTEEDLAALERNVEKADVNVAVKLGETVVSLRDLMSLQVGDVVIFDKETSEPLTTTVNDIPKFEVFPGTHKDRMVVQVANVITGTEE